MKKVTFLLAFVSLFFFACEEIPPVVTGVMGDMGPPNPTSQQRQVLIEEFTGVRCVNCPAGSAVIEDLLTVYGSRLIAISIHAGDFSFPYPENLYNFITDDGDAIINYVGVPFGYPSAVINRNQFAGEFGLQLGSSKWAGYISEETTEAPKVKIGTQHDFDLTTRNMDLDIALFVQEDILEGDVHLSVFITENNIEDVQLTPSGKQADYIHKHVFRTAITSFDGDPLTETLITGVQIDKSYSYTLPSNWDENNCNIVVFVSLAGDEKDILQAHEVHVVE